MCDPGQEWRRAGKKHERSPGPLSHGAGGLQVIFPLPRPKIRGAGIVAVEVEPSVAFSVQLRQLRLRSGLTQAEAARRLGMNSLYSYQRLERRPNPSLSMMKNVKRVFPELSVDLALGE